MSAGLQGNANSAVHVDDVGWPCVLRSVNWCAVVRGGMVFLREARHDTVVEMVWVLVCRVVVCLCQRSWDNFGWMRGSFLAYF